MSLFYHHEEPPDSSSKKYKFLTLALKDAFSNCHSFGGRRSNSEEDDPGSDIDNEQEVVVSEIRSRAMEAKERRKASFTMDNSFCWVLSSTTGDLFITPKAVQQKENGDDDEGKEDFLSVKSCLSRCSSATTMEAFFSVKTNFSRCSSLNRLDFQDLWNCLSFNGLDFQDFRRRSIIQELRHCEGWPFGLCRKALLLPPLPKSPSESWTWRKHGRIVKLH
ncbi:uncharacterized protein LOC132280167 [Cornus florida]|uniref:uncharacterized protein LOC132280167 n=1 Tax=Cornus florida TaxID=4283 RepID=UPI0028A11FA9|nr:uncharacterized protein LOC132280167 [Cornus florida]